LTAAATDVRELLGERARTLIPTWVTTVEELLLREYVNISGARQWAFRSASRKHTPRLFGAAFLTELHSRMFNGIWTWAGQLRRSDDPEGVRWPTIAIELNDLAGEARFWSERRIYQPDELALRFHHRLYRIRVWEGGNGTHARLAADTISVSLAQTPFSWGAGRHAQPGEAREQWNSAMRAADGGDLRPLRDFARSL
jgi:Fic-DOC domain mobile mystery protein B